MANQHPVTPPPELVGQWDEKGTNMFRPAYQTHLCTQAAQWGYQQAIEELETFLRKSNDAH